MVTTSSWLILLGFSVDPLLAQQTKGQSAPKTPSTSASTRTEYDANGYLKDRGVYRRPPDPPPPTSHDELLTIGPAQPDGVPVNKSKEPLRNSGKTETVQPDGAAGNKSKGPLPTSGQKEKVPAPRLSTGKTVPQIMKDLNARKAELNGELDKIASSLYESADKQIVTQLELYKSAASLHPAGKAIKALDSLYKSYEAYTADNLKEASAYAVKAAAEFLPSQAAEMGQILKNAADLTAAAARAERGDNEAAAGKFADVAVRGALDKIAKDTALKLLKSVYDSAKSATAEFQEMAHFGDLQDEHRVRIIELGRINRALQALTESTENAEIQQNGMYHSLDGGKTWHLNQGTPFASVNKGTADLRALLDEGHNKTPEQNQQVVIFEGSTHSIDGGKTWLQNAGSHYPETLDGVVVGMYHTLDGGETWLLNSGTPFQNYVSGMSDAATGLTDRQVLERARQANTSLVAQQQQADKDLNALQQQNEVSLASSTEAFDQNVSRAQTELSNNRNSFVPSPGDDQGMSLTDRVLPLVQSNLQRLNQYYLRSHTHQTTALAGATGIEGKWRVTKQRMIMTGGDNLSQGAYSPTEGAGASVVCEMQSLISGGYQFSCPEAGSAVLTKTGNELLSSSVSVPGAGAGNQFSWKIFLLDADTNMKATFTQTSGPTTYRFEFTGTKMRQ